MTYVVKYARVSTPEQRINGTGFVRQDEAMDLFCKMRGWVPNLSVYEDVSGAVDSAYRVELLDVFDKLSRIEDDEKIIVVENSSRWARDLIVGEVLLSKCNQLGIRVWSAQEGIEMTADDPGNPAAVAIRQILAVMAQLDKANIVLRLKAARTIRRRTDGKAKSGIGPAGVEGKKPYGMLDGERQTLIKMLDMRSSGASYSEIASELNVQRIRTRKGKLWIKRTVGRILKNVRSLNLVADSYK